MCVDSTGSVTLIAGSSSFKVGLMTYFSDFRTAMETAVAIPIKEIPASSSASEVAFIPFESSSVFYNGDSLVYGKGK